MIPMLLLVAALVIPQPRHAIERGLRYVFTPPPPPTYCVETRECCLKPADCSILRMLPHR